MSDFNQRVIDEFRANDGSVGGPFEEAQLALLSTTGARTGERRVSPVMYFTEGGDYYVLASKAGAPTNPAWFHNLVANPTVGVELATDHGVETFDATAEVVAGAERDRLFDRFAGLNPGFEEYQLRTDRIIPVVRLSRG
jgi:deazaflavin-dependent oxidoreductase (nitroreductase family)